MRKIRKLWRRHYALAQTVFVCNSLSHYVGPKYSAGSACPVNTTLNKHQVQLANMKQIKNFRDFFSKTLSNLPRFSCVYLERSMLIFLNTYQTIRTQTRCASL